MRHTSLPLGAALTLSSRVLPFKRQVDGPLEDFRHVPLRIFDPKDLGEPLELLLEDFPGGEAEVVYLRLRGFEEAPWSGRRPDGLPEKRSRIGSLFASP